MPSPEKPRLPIHRRTLTFDVYNAGDSVEVTGRLTDVRPWAEASGHEMVHDMQLDVTVRKADLVILDAAATMHTFPHAECPQIEEAFGQMVGLSIGRGYTKAITERFVGVFGCSHLEHLARSLGPAVIQAIASGYSKQYAEGELPPIVRRSGAGAGGGAPWLKNTCHIWAEGGIGEQKIVLGGMPSDREYPVPALAVLKERRRAEGAG